MPVDFLCPHCQARTLVEDAYCGQTGPCFSCGKPVSVPEPGRNAATAKQPVRRASGSRLAIFGVLASGLITLGLVAAIAIHFALPSIRAARTRVSLARCSANLKRIHVALQQYHQEYGTYPPAYLTDSQGKPTLSWRVLILPQLNEMELYRQLNLTEPWDSPHNMSLGRLMPAVFHCDADPAVGVSEETSYMAVVGPRTLFPGSKSRSLNDVLDDHATTLMIVESHLSEVHWMRPVDVAVGALKQGVNGTSRAKEPLLASEHPDAASVLCIDGTVRRLPTVTLTDLLQAMATIDGREPIRSEDILLAEDP
ncbi:MAG: DUF1559 domain-containing protein [Planctomycetota bacterium]